MDRRFEAVLPGKLYFRWGAEKYTKYTEVILKVNGANNKEQQNPFCSSRGTQWLRGLMSVGGP